jgi:hypothetical protein
MSMVALKIKEYLEGKLARLENFTMYELRRELNINNLDVISIGMLIKKMGWIKKQKKKGERYYTHWEIIQRTENPLKNRYYSRTDENYAPQWPKSTS